MAINLNHIDNSVLIGTSEKLRIDANGDLGLGIAAVPQDSGAKTLHIHHPTSGNPARAHIRLTTGTSGSAASNGALLGLDYSNNLYLYNHENGDLRVGTNDLERLRIRSDGHIVIDTTFNGYGGLKIYDDSGGDYNVRYIAGRNQSATSHVFMNSGRTQNQSPWADATPSEQARITRGGIAFGGDTAEVNTLQEYEEGDYTAHFNLEGQGNMSMSGRVGKYIKIGKTCTVLGGGQVSGSPGNRSTSIAIEFSNLPFASATTSVGSVGYPFIVKLSDMSGDLDSMAGDEPYQFIGRLNSNATSGRIEALRKGSNQNPQNASYALHSTTQIQYMFTYIIT